MKNLQVDRKTTKQVRIDVGYHQLLRIEAAKSGRTIKKVLEDMLMESLAVDKMT